ncbi:MAG: DUF1289 domain-containing protein [Candidatus Saccharibacteria bacterium]|nr:DUF1289 domain-containing protein [Pseudorhodobacter sp.]
MNDDIWTRAEVDSPCIKVCVIHPEERLCVGCLRTIEEIATWSRLSAVERQAVTTDLPSRAAKLTRRRGGRIGRLDR